MSEVKDSPVAKEEKETNLENPVFAEYLQKLQAKILNTGVPEKLLIHSYLRFSCKDNKGDFVRIIIKYPYLLSHRSSEDRGTAQVLTHYYGEHEHAYGFDISPDGQVDKFKDLSDYNRGDNSDIHPSAEPPQNAVDMTYVYLKRDAHFDGLEFYLEMERPTYGS